MKKSKISLLLLSLLALSSCSLLSPTKPAESSAQPAESATQQPSSEQQPTPSSENQPAQTSEDIENPDELDAKLHEIYVLYANNGGSLTYEEWLETIKGEDGTNLLTGSTDPGPAIGKDGDLYLNTATWDLFSKSSGYWWKLGNVKGADGQDGKDGKDGKDGQDGQDGQTAWSCTILPSEHGYVTPNKGSAVAGDSITFYVYPDAGYRLSTLFVNWVDVTADVVENAYTTLMQEFGFVVKAEFALQGEAVHTHTFDESTWLYNDTVHWHPATCGHDARKGEAVHEFGDLIVDVEPTATEDGHGYYKCGVCGYTKEALVPATGAVSGIQTITIYASNDFHGAVAENDDEVGLVTYASYFKAKGAQPNTLLLDQGDSWQGSVYSNMNYGALVNDVMVEAGWDARTIGNHDFDWGVNAIKANTARLYNGKTLTTLAANVYDYDFDTKTFGNTQQSAIGQKTAIFQMENGLKVGVVGVIGKDQITSINSLYTHDIGFKDHIPVIKEEAANLRRQGCDIVIASCHTGQEDLMGNGLADYVDLVLCGHTHRYEIDSSEGITYAQFYKNGINAGEITLTYDADAKKVTKTTTNRIQSQDIRSSVNLVDSTIARLVQVSNAQCDEAASEVVANNVTDSFYKGQSLEPLMVQAMYDTAVAEGHTDIICSYANDARCNYISPTNGRLTYADLYKAFPFDNTVYIIEVTGKEIMNELNKYNYACFSDAFVNGGKQIVQGQKYKIACLDYLTFHTNSNRYYDYFDDNAGNYLGTLQNNYRVILKNWLSQKGYASGTELNPDNFQRSMARFDNIGQITYGSGTVQTPTSGYSATILPTTFQEGSTTTPVEAVGADGKTVSFNLMHPAMTTGVDNESNNAAVFKIPSQSYLQVSAPEGYKISEITMRCYRTYENFNFYDGFAVDDTKILSEVTETGSTPTYWISYKVAANCSDVYIFNTYTGNSFMLVYEMGVVLNLA